MLSGSALRAYDDAIRTQGELHVRHRLGGPVTRVDMARYLAAADRADLTVLDHCAGPVLDIGCGPGRIASAVAAAGLPALGIDVAPQAVRSTRSRGARALRCDVFGTVPAAGTWGTALLIDGNIGIGGDPGRLLERIHALLAAGGRLIVETDPDRGRDERADLVLLRPDGDAAPAGFAWARVGRDPLAVLARRRGFTVSTTWSAGGRDFSVLEAVPAVCRPAGRPARSRGPARATVDLVSA